MKKRHIAIALTCAFICLFTVGCKKNNNGNVWDDNHATGNYKGNARTLWESTENAQEAAFLAPSEEDFVALTDTDLKKTSFSDGAVPQPKMEPGTLGSGLPSITQFYKPAGSEAAVFKNALFNTDDHILRGKESITSIERVAEYLRTHSNIYLFIEGHADERGPEAYNLALGSRRANYVRSLLVQKGIDAERVHTISYGKERPADLGHNPESWSKNRRAEFKIFKKG